MGNIFSGLQAVGDAIASVMQPQQPQQPAQPQAAADEPLLPELREDAQQNEAAGAQQQPAQPNASQYPMNDDEIDRVAQDFGNIDFEQESRRRRAANPVNNAEQVQEAAPVENLSLNQALYLLRIEGIAYIEENVKRGYAEIKKLQQSSDALTTLLAKISDGYAAGSLDYTGNDEIIGLMQQARDLGATVPEETVLDKTQLESLVRNLEAKNKSVDTNIKLKLQESDEYTRNRNNFYEVAKSIDDKTSRAIEKILHAIKGG